MLDQIKLHVGIQNIPKSNNTALQETSLFKHLYTRQGMS